MKNPFVDFCAVPCKRREIPLQRIVQARRETMDRMVQGYLQLMDQEVKDLVWLVEQSRVVRAYNTACQSIRDLQYDQDDIEEFCTELHSGHKISYGVSGPSGIFLSALVNQSQEEQVVLRLAEYDRKLHFLGYRLPEGKTLVLQGDAGNFLGVDLSGGRLVAEGSTGNWCGAGMMKGQIMVAQNAGEKTGEWMRDGEIRVDGRIQSLGKNLLGGRIYQRGKLVYPEKPAAEGWEGTDGAAG